ncbi:hypothetical protein BD408DRAFT_427050 [Parasitella parasitica]|nr:hypothetical protein BD408DRAFT_427050 [Parasitella parasitica]
MMPKASIIAIATLLAVLSTRGWSLTRKSPPDPLHIHRQEVVLANSCFGSLSTLQYCQPQNGHFRGGSLSVKFFYWVQARSHNFGHYIYEHFGRMQPF